MEPTAIEAENFRKVQLTKYDFLYVLNVPVANNTTLPAFLTIEEDADFKVKSFTGSVLGPTDVNGARLASIATIFPLAGTTAGYADRGIMARITDAGAGRVLTSSFVPLETILSPGYGVPLQCPFPFNYMLKRNSKVQFDLRNRDTTVSGGATVYYHFVSICLFGTKYTS